MLKDLILKNRSTRRFRQEVSVDRQTLRELVDYARLSPSGANLQPLKYVLACDPELNARIFPTLAWAAYLKDWGGPAEGERPAAYIVILGDTAVAKSFGVDPGIAAQSILLAAVERGLAGCILASIKRDALREVLDLPERYEILLVLALGQAGETIQLEPLGDQGDIKYWRDAQGGHHVPKRALEEIILE